MPNLTSVLRSEIRRLARQETRAEIATLRKQAAQYRRDIAALKRQNEELQRRMKFVERQERKRLTSDTVSQEAADQVRFSPKWVAAHRKKLGLSAADYGKLVGVSLLTIYNWEHGKSSPRRKQLAQWAAVRDIKSKSEARKRLEMLGK